MAAANVPVFGSQPGSDRRTKPSPSLADAESECVTNSKDHRPSVGSGTDERAMSEEGEAERRYRTRTTRETCVTSSACMRTM